MLMHPYNLMCNDDEYLLKLHYGAVLSIEFVLCLIMTSIITYVVMLQAKCINYFCYYSPLTL